MQLQLVKEISWTLSNSLLLVVEYGDSCINDCNEEVKITNATFTTNVMRSHGFPHIA